MFALARNTVVGAIIAGLALCPIMLSFGGCAAPPVSQTQQIINTFTLAQRKIAEGRTDVQRTLATLDKYCSRPGHATYDAFVQNAMATEKVADETRNISAVMMDQGNAFFADWDHQIAAMTNEDLKEHTAARKDSAQAMFSQIHIQAPAAWAAYDSFIDDLKNLQTFFDYDKTPAGVAAAAQLVHKTRSDGTELERQLDLEAANLKQVNATFTAMQRG